MTLRVMGVDLSTKTGIAVVDQRKKLISAAEYEFEGVAGYERCQAIAEQVRSLVQVHAPDLICIESPITSSKFNNFVQTEIAVAVRYDLWANGIGFVNVSPSSLKKFISGSGNCNKNVIMMAVYKQWGVECPTDNIADAVGLSMWGLCCLGVDFGALKKKTVQETLKKLGGPSMQLIAQASLTN